MLNPNPYMVLSGVLGFSAADLTANRLGVMTANQRENLYAQRIQALKWPAAVLMLVVVGGLLIQAEWLVIAFCAACIVSVMVAIWVRYTQDLESPVEAIAGKWKAQRSTLGRYAVDIGGSVFTLPQSAQRAFTESARYRLYYTPGTRTILSAEMLNS